MAAPVRVSVFMPVYNAGAHLREAITSILDQTFKNFEFVILNDGSTDASLDMICSFSDKRIRLINNPENIGLIASLNIGLKECLGEYIVRMDQDDISLPERISRQVTFMDSHPAIGLMGSWFEDFSDTNEGNVIRYDCFDTEIRIRHLHQTHISHPTAIIRTSVVRAHQLSFDPSFIHGEDYEFWVRMSGFCKLANYPECLVRKRDHVNNISNKYASDQQHSIRRVKLKQFDAMGISLSADQLKLYDRFADSEWNFSESEMEMLNELLPRITEANDSSNFIPVAEFSQYIGRKWFHLCLNHPVLKRRAWSFYMGSPLRLRVKTGLVNTLKLLLKKRLAAR